MVDPLRVAAASEIATGLALILFPGPVTSLLFDADAAGAGLAMARLAGMALVGLGIACWPGASRGRTAMLVYGALAAIYLSGLGMDGGARGPLLWPVVVIHLVISALLVRSSAVRSVSSVS